MIVSSVQAPQLGELGFSLKPPKWLRNAVTSIVSSAKVTVPTPAGPINPLEPGAVDQIRDAISRTTVTIGKQPAANTTGVTEFVESKVPGGWLGIGAGAVLLFLLASRRGR